MVSFHLAESSEAVRNTFMQFGMSSVFFIRPPIIAKFSQCHELSLSPKFNVLAMKNVLAIFRYSWGKPLSPACSNCSLQFTSVLFALARSVTNSCLCLFCNSVISS